MTNREGEETPAPDRLVPLMEFSQLTPQDVVTLLRVGYEASASDYYPEEGELPDRLDQIVEAHLDDIAAHDHERAIATLEAFASSPLAADRIEASSLLIPFTHYHHDKAIPFWERLLLDANELVSDEFELKLTDLLESHGGSVNDPVRGLGLMPLDILRLLELREQAKADGKLYDLGRAAVQKLIASQPDGPIRMVPIERRW